MQHLFRHVLGGFCPEFPPGRSIFLTVVSVANLSHSTTYRDIISIRPRPSSSESFQIHHLSLTLPFNTKFGSAYVSLKFDSHVSEDKFRSLKALLIVTVLVLKYSMKYVMSI
jgi:hypothetical protein